MSVGRDSGKLAVHGAFLNDNTRDSLVISHEIPERSKDCHIIAST